MLLVGECIGDSYELEGGSGLGPYRSTTWRCGRVRTHSQVLLVVSACGRANGGVLLLFSFSPSDLSPREPMCCDARVRCFLG